MKALLDGIEVTGTPEEIDALLRLRRQAEDWPLREPSEVQPWQPWPRAMPPYSSGSTFDGRPEREYQVFISSNELQSRAAERRYELDRALAGESFDGWRVT